MDNINSLGSLDGWTGAFPHIKLLREAFNKKKTEKSDIVQKGRVGWTPKPYFRKEWNSDTIVG